MCLKGFYFNPKIKIIIKNEHVYDTVIYLNTTKSNYEKRLILKKIMISFTIGLNFRIIGKTILYLIYNFAMIIKLPKNCKKRPNLPKILKVETIFNYPILCQSASINRWRHWKTRDLGVWHQASKAVKDAILKVSSIVLSVKITSKLHTLEKMRNIFF